MVDSEIPAAMTSGSGMAAGWRRSRYTTPGSCYGYPQRVPGAISASPCPVHPQADETAIDRSECRIARRTRAVPGQ